MDVSLVRDFEDIRFLEVCFTPDEHWCAMAASCREMLGEGACRPADALLSVRGFLKGSPYRGAVTKNAVAVLLRGAMGQVVQALGADPENGLAVSGFSEKEDGSLAIRISAANAGRRPVKYEGLSVVAAQVVLDGGEVDRRIEEGLRHYGESDAERLAARLRVYADAATMREALATSLGNHVEDLNARIRKQATIDALLEANDAHAADGEVDRYVDGVIETLRNQSDGDTFNRLVESKNGGMQLLRTLIGEQEGYAAALIPILSAIAWERGLSATDEARLAEIHAQASMAIDPSSMRDAEDILAAVKAEPEALKALDAKVVRNMALDYVIEHSRFSVEGAISLEEAEARYWRPQVAI